MATEKSKQQETITDEHLRIKAEADQKEERRLSRLTNKQLFAEARKTSRTCRPKDAAFLIVCDILSGNNQENNRYRLTYTGKPR